MCILILIFHTNFLECLVLIETSCVHNIQNKTVILNYCCSLLDKQQAFRERHNHSYSLLFRRQFYFQGLAYALKVFNYFFTAVFILEAGMKIAALGCGRYLNDRLVYLYYEYILLKNKNSSRIIQCMSSIF